MQFICPHCKILLEANIALSGELCKCRNCGGDIIVRALAPSSGPINESNTNGTAPLAESTPAPKSLKPEDIITKRYDEKFPNIGQAILLILGYLFISILVGLPVYYFLELINPELTNHPTIFYGTIALISIIILVKYTSYRTGIAISDLIPIGRLKPGLIFTAFIAAFGIGLVLISLSILIIEILPTFKEPLGKFSPDISSQFKLSSWGTLIKLIILGPIAEEILNRGVILRGFLKNYSIKKAVIASALIFGFLHLNPIQILAATVSGVFLGLIYIKTNSILSCIFLHSFINFWLMSIFSIGTYASSRQEAPSSESISLIFLISTFVIGLFLFGIGTRLFIKKYRK